MPADADVACLPWSLSISICQGLNLSICSYWNSVPISTYSLPVVKGPASNFSQSQHSCSQRCYVRWYKVGTCYWLLIVQGNIWPCAKNFIPLNPLSTLFYRWGNRGSESVLVSKSCHNKIPQTSWLKQEKYIFSWFRSLEVSDQHVHRIFSLKAFLLGWQMAAFLLCLLVVIPLCTYIAASYSPFKDLSPVIVTF